MLKATYEKATAYIILNREKVENISLKFGTGQ
jgi:hypothetical protein